MRQCVSGNPRPVTIRAVLLTASHPTELLGEINKAALLCDGNCAWHRKVRVMRETEMEKRKSS